MPDERCVHIAAITTVRHAKRRECEECVKMGARWVHLRTCQECGTTQDRKSTRLNSSHSQISYAVFCLKKKHLRRGEGGPDAGGWRRGAGKPDRPDTGTDEQGELTGRNPACRVRSRRALGEAVPAAEIRRPGVRRPQYLASLCRVVRREPRPSQTCPGD